MSRGGFRGGRGGGRGGGGGGGALRDLIQPTADMNIAQWHEEMRKRPEHAGMLYPPLEQKAHATIPGPSTDEEVLIDYSRSLYAFLEKGTDLPGERAPTPWRRMGERKVVGIEIETYSGSLNVESDQTASSSRTLDAAALYLDEKNFPASLWDSAFNEEAEVEAAAKRKRLEKERAKKRRRQDVDGDGQDVVSEDEAEVRSNSGSDSEGDFDFEDEEEDHQDYDANYFDNGEGDDDDEGGDDDGGGGDSWD